MAFKHKEMTLIICSDSVRLLNNYINILLLHSWMGTHWTKLKQEYG